MPATSSGGRSAGAGLRGVQVNPILVIVIALLVVGGLGYFFWLRPEQEYAKIKREWNSEESAAARAPENRKSDPAHERVLANLKRNERGGAEGNDNSSRTR
jgi:hypothetical protein